MKTILRRVSPKGRDEIAELEKLQAYFGEDSTAELLRVCLHRLVLVIDAVANSDRGVLPPWWTLAIPVALSAASLEESVHLAFIDATLLQMDGVDDTTRSAIREAASKLFLKSKSSETS
ncbi:hypothetical protein [Thiocapsa sp.]|uniref:hypothetical protein n=1 Tax=Thiocapsa sp. TaxID=2024551 RepID=UPI003593A70C